MKIGNPQREQGIGPSLTLRVTCVLTTGYVASCKILLRFGLPWIRSYVARPKRLASSIELQSDDARLGNHPTEWT